MKVFVTLFFALLLQVALADTTRVLFIGNSYIYSNDLPGLVRQLALSMGDTVETGMSAPGGHTFQQHSTNPTTQAFIALGNWDFVVLQEQSQRPAFPPEQVAQEVLPYATQLVQQVRSANPCTEVIFMMTWGRENGDAANCPNYPPLCTYDGMQQRLRESYLLMAQQNDAWCTPMGVVWQAHRNAFPDRGLYTDGSHPNMLGSYLAANTLVGTMKRASTAAASFVPNALEADEALFVRTLASGIVLDSLGTWNIGVNDPTALFDVNDLGGGSFLFANNTAEAVSQSWSFGDGSTSNEFDPLHTYTTPGMYTVALITADACGRTDTATAEVEFVPSSIGEDQRATVATLDVDHTTGLLRWHGPDHAGQLELIDTSGRTLLMRQMPAGSTVVHRPTGSTGTLLWRFTSPSGERLGGRTLLR